MRKNETKMAEIPFSKRFLKIFFHICGVIPTPGSGSSNSYEYRYGSVQIRLRIRNPETDNDSPTGTKGSRNLIFENKLFIAGDQSLQD
jgi:hypothetical protein